MSSILAPETLEGWYCLHQLFTIDRAALRAMDAHERAALRAGARTMLAEIAAPKSGAGWSAVVDIVGSTADVMLVHFRKTLEELREVQDRIALEAVSDVLLPGYSFLSITEAGLYHITADLAKQATKRGGEPGDEQYMKDLAERAAKERESAHIQKRLYPALPPDMPYVCFYPMDKKREGADNWYSLPLEERSRLMWAHGMTGRRYAGKVQQIISGAIGFDAWEWGVTLFAKDPLDFKKLVTEMRFDEVSARYAAFGEFFVGKVASPEEWVRSL